MSTIVIGIDFGTTYSGVSYGSLPQDEHAIKVINDWPVRGTANANNDKVPTAIVYNEHGQPVQWGHLANPDHERCLRWFKLLLEPDKYRDGQNAEEVRKAKAVIAELKKTVDDVIADYLSCIWKYSLDHIARRYAIDVETFQKAYRLRVTLTTPAIWDLNAQNRTKCAAEKAGIPQPWIVAEPEAATLSVLEDKAQFLKAKVNDCFVICDAGGGTVDLVTYQITGLNPMSIKEIVAGDGDLCGSVFLDDQFERLIATKVGPDIYRSLPKRRRRAMMVMFELNLKRAFGYERGDTSIELRGVEDNEDEGIEDETITLSYNSISSIFDTVYLRIQYLVQRQIEATVAKDQIVKAILLAGGFGESRYLQDRLRESNPEASVFVARNAWSAITRGATIYGLNRIANVLKPDTKPLIVQSRILRHSYGTLCKQKFNPAVHDETRDMDWDPLEKEVIAKNQVEWFLKRHQEISANDTKSITFFRLYDCANTGQDEYLSFPSKIVVSSKDKPPPRMESDMESFLLVSKVKRRDAISRWTMRSRPAGRKPGSKYYPIKFDINVHCGNLSTFHFTSTFGDVEGGKVKIDFSQSEA